MKKRFLLLFSAFILVLAVFLGGCLGGNKGGGGNTVPDPGKDPETPAEEVFFDYSALNYNPECSNPSDPNEKGFIIYDNIDFTLVTFRVATPMSPYFIISQGNKVFATIKKPDTLPSYPVAIFYNIPRQQGVCDHRKTGHFALLSLFQPR